MTEEELNAIEARFKVTTPGPWYLREDHDYYQGGTYIGSGPQKYVPDPAGKGNSLVPCDASEVQYFEQDIARVESGC